MMDAKPASHPTDELLSAFGLGKLADPEADTIAHHVGTCDTCRERVGGLSGDDFLSRLKDAQRQGANPAASDSPTALRRPVPAPPAADGEVIPLELATHPQYEDVRELGRGGMGVVYRARNRLMDRVEVLKVANRALLTAPGAAERFLQEARSAGQLRHPNVVTAYAILELDQLLVFAMEFVPGEDLNKLVKARGPLPAGEACEYARQAALGLQHAHEKGMVHRDIKPHNLILTREGGKSVVRILDFGLAKLTREGADAGLTGDGKMLGTPHYIAPEQSVDATRAGIRADIYSLGCTLYFLLTGKPPFSGSVYEVLQAHHSVEATPVHHVRPGVPEGVAAVVAKMMAKDPAARYQTPGEVAEALAPFAATAEPRSPRPATSPSPPPSAPRQTGQWALWAALVAGVLGAGLAIAWGVGAFKVKTKDGTLVLENLPDDADVFVDGERVSVTWGEGKKAEVRVAPGTRKVEIKKDGVTVRGEEVEVDEGGRRILTAKLDPPAPAPVPPVVRDGTPQPKEKEPPVANDGYVSLFNGKDLTGWEAFKRGTPNRRPPWRVVDGVLMAHFDTFGSWGFILTERDDYQNFRFRVEMTPVDGDGWAGSMLYLWRDGNWHRANIGSSSGRDVEETGVIQIGNVRVAPKLPVKFRSGRWFMQEVVVEGRRISVYVNGVLVTKHALAEVPKPGRLGITLSGVGTMKIRKMEVKELPAPKPADSK